MIDITKLRHWAIMLFIAICPIIYNNTNLMDLREFQERSFQILAIALFAFFVGNLWIGAFILLNVSLLLLNDWTVGLPQVLNVLLGGVLFLISRSYFKGRNFKPYAQVLLWIGVLNLLWMILQASGIDPLYISQSSSGAPQLKATFRDFSGLFGLKEVNGTFLAIVIPILASINLWLVPLLLIPIYFCSSSAVVLAIFISMAFYLYYNHRKLFIYFVVIGTILGCLYAYHDMKDDQSTFKSRLPMWHAALKYTLKHPQGYGPDSWRNYNKQKDFLFYADYDYTPIMLKKISEDKAIMSFYAMDNGEMYEKNHSPLKNSTLNWWDNPHNEYIQMMFEYGFIGLFLLFGMMREMFYRFKFSNKSGELIIITSCLLVYVVTGLGHFPLHLARTACLFPIFLGAFYARTDEVLNA